MDTLTAFAMGQANRHRPSMVFDWEKAARIIRDLSFGPRTVKAAAAGLRGDWEFTGGDIYRYGAPVPAEDTYTYLASTWAVPELMVDGETFECYVMEDEKPEWDSDSYWPQEALEILNKLK